MKKTFKDQIPPAGGRRYVIRANTDGTTSIEDVTKYQQEGTPFGAKEAMQLYDGIVPPGAVMPYAGTAAPDGWLLCDGSAVSRTTYAALFAAIGTAFGAGDGKTTFALPDLRGNVPAGAASGHALASKEGERTHTLTTGELPQFQLNMDGIYLYQEGQGGGFNGSGNCKLGNRNTTKIGSNQPHNNMQPTIYLNYIIKC